MPDAGLLEGKVVLVSGGTQGVGAGVAPAAVREGAEVVVTGRRRSRREVVAELTGAGPRAVRAGRRGRRRQARGRWPPRWPSSAGPTAWSTRPG